MPCSIIFRASRSHVAQLYSLMPRLYNSLAMYLVSGVLHNQTGSHSGRSAKSRMRNCVRITTHRAMKNVTLSPLNFLCTAAFVPLIVSGYLCCNTPVAGYGVEADGAPASCRTYRTDNQAECVQASSRLSYRSSKADTAGCDKYSVETPRRLNLPSSFLRCLLLS
jgi:hypothetical protein